MVAAAPACCGKIGSAAARLNSATPNANPREGRTWRTTPKSTIAMATSAGRRILITPLIVKISAKNQAVMALPVGLVQMSVSRLPREANAEKPSILTRPVSPRRHVIGSRLGGDAVEKDCTGHSL